MLDPAELGDLGSLMDPDPARRLLGDAGLRCGAVRPNHLRLKLGESALIGFDLVGDGDRPPVVPAYARTFVDPSRAQRAHDKAQSKRIVDTAVGPGVVLLDGGRTVVHVFPNDAELGELHRVVRVSKCVRMLAELPTFDGVRVDKHRSTVEVVRYKPERRAILRIGAAVDGPGDGGVLDLHGRWFADRRGVAGNAIAMALHAAGVDVAPPLGTVAEGRLSVERTAPGIDGVTALVGGLLDAERLGHQLAKLHGVSTTTSLTGRRRTPDVALGGALAALGAMSTLETDLTGAACRLAVELRGRMPAAGRSAGVHGDLHLGQLIVGSDSVTLIDLERFAVGDPVGDLASLVAHLIAVPVLHPDVDTATAVGAVRDAWRRRSGASDAGFGGWLACALVERALLAARTFEPGWRVTAAVLLDRALDEIGGRRWSVIHPRPNGSWSATDDAPNPGYAVIGDHDVTVRNPMSDRDLPALRAVLESGALRSYRPGRRAVVGTDDGFVKVIRPKRSGDVVARWGAVAHAVDRAGGTFAVPRVQAGSRPSDGVLVLDAVPGSALYDTLIGSSDPTARVGAIRSAVEVAARFHDLDVHGVDLPTASSGGTPADWIAVLDRVHPGLVGPYRAVAARLPDVSTAGPVTFVHGDLHDRNVLLGDHGGGIIDLDGVGLGDPAIDVGNLAAHVLLRALQRGDSIAVGRAEAAIVLAEHPHGGPRARSWGAHTLFRLSVLYRFRMRWAHLAPGFLAEASAWATDDAGERVG